MKHLFFLFCILAFSTVFSQEVTGLIVDQEGKPLEGVNIFSSITEKGSISNKNGVYKITVSANQFQQLQFTFLGFKSKKPIL